MSILVSPLAYLGEVIHRRRPTRIVSLLDPGLPFPDFGPEFGDRHLRLAFHDVDVSTPGVTVPSSLHIAELLAFLDRGDPSETLLVHCRAGIGRSTAAAFIVACHRNPMASELAIAVALRRAAPAARPNETLVRVADDVMRRDGRMSSAISDTGRGLTWADRPPAQPFELPSLFTTT